MKKALLAVILSIAAPLLADGRTYTITDDGKNYATFESHATLETIHGTTTKVSGTITADAANASASAATITVDLNALDTGISMRNEHMRGEKFLDTEKYPAATFKTVSISGAKSVAPNQPAELQLTGDFTLHGVTKRITVPARVVLIPENDNTKSSRGPGDWIHGTVTFAIKLTDYAIPVPEKLVMKLSNDVTVKVDFFAVAR
ncbi:MAG TPA: YceI family protein [Thermoanaerobaculia bacterium]|nr:YceI family protein [Thermoanaerobaculia bacterium]